MIREFNKFYNLTLVILYLEGVDCSESHPLIHRLRLLHLFLVSQGRRGSKVVG